MKDKYVKFIAPFVHTVNGIDCHIGPFKSENDIGTLNPELNRYEFPRRVENVNGSKEWVDGLHLDYDYVHSLGSKVEFWEQNFFTFYSDEHRRNYEQFERRLFAAKSGVDIMVAEMYLNAAELSRLERKKETLLNETK